MKKTIRFNRYFNIINESLDEDSYTTLGYKIFEGNVHNIKLSVIKFIDEQLPARIMIKSLNDPKISGFLEYDSKRDTIMAFNNIGTLSNLLDYIGRYIDNPTAYSLIHIKNDETPEEEKAKEETMPSAEFGELS